MCRMCKHPGPIEDERSWLAHWFRTKRGANHVGYFVQSLCARHWEQIIAILPLALADAEAW
jgi:hypothetical protein